MDPPTRRSPVVSQPVYTTKRLSNYDGFKALDKLQEKIAEGRLKPPRQNAKDYLCPLCSYRKRSLVLCPSRVLGVPVSQLPIKVETRFQGRFILCCEDCVRDLKRARVA